MTVFKWLQAGGTANQSSDSTINWAEGQAPSSVNDSARAMMSAIAKWRDDIGGTLATAGGPANFTIATTNQNFATFASPPPNGTSITFVMNQTNAAGAQLSIDGGTFYPLRTDTATAAPAGILTANAAYSATFKTSVNAWVLNNLYNIQAGIAPIGSITPYAGVGDPNINFLICDGRSLAQSSYTFLFNTVWGGVKLFGGTNPNFLLPDLRGRVIAGCDFTQLRLTTATMTLNPVSGNQFGATGGVETRIQLATEMPSHKHDVALSNEGTGHRHAAPGGASFIMSGAVSPVIGTGTGTTGNFTDFATTGLTISESTKGSSAAMPLVQPTMQLSYLIRVL